MRFPLFLLLMLYSYGLFSQNGPLMQRLDQAKELYAQEEYKAYETEILRLLAHPDAKKEKGLYWLLLMEAGSVTIDFAKYEQAYDYYHQALHYEEDGQGPPDSLLATIYNDLGYIRGEQSRFEEQLALYEKSLEYRIALYGPTHSETARSYNNIGYCYGRMRNYDQQLIYFQKALAIRIAFYGEVHAQTANSFNNLGYCYGRLGDYDSELEYYLKALKVRKAILGERHSLVARTLGNIGYHYYNTRQYDKAIAHFEAGMAIYTEIFGPDHPDVVSSLENIANAYGRLGYLDKCLLYLNKAQEINLKFYGARSESEVQNLNNQAVFSLRLGEYEKAAGLFEKSLEISQEIWGKDSKMAIDRMIKVGIANLEQGKYSKSLEIFNKAFERYHPTISPPNFELAEIHFRRGSLYIHLDSLDRAIKDLREGSKQFLQLHDEVSSSSIHQVIGDYFYHQGKYDSTIYYNNVAIQFLVPDFTWKEPQENPLSEQLISEEQLLYALEGKGKAFYQKGIDEADAKALKHALATFELAIETLEKKRFERGEKTIRLFSKEIRELFSQLIQTATRLYDMTQDAQYLEGVFEAMDHSRAYLLRERLQAEQVAQFSGVPDSLLGQDRVLKQELVFYQNKIKDAEGNASYDSAKVARWKDYLVEKQRQRDQLLGTLSRSFPRYFALKHATPDISLQQIQGDLSKKGANLITYFHADSTIYAMVITPKGNHLQAIPLPPHFEHLSHQFLNELRQPDLVKAPQEAFSRFCQSSYALYELLVAPLIDDIPHNERLIIIPDGSLGYIPFECLIQTLPADLTQVNYAALDFLIKRLEIGYSYHNQYPDQRNKGKKLKYVAFAPSFGPAVVGDSLRQNLPVLSYAQEETDALAKSFDGQLYQAEQASESLFKSLAPAFSMLHLATHSWVSDGERGAPYLVFSKDVEGKEDGKLHSYELYNLDLSAEIAVLSACNTGVGKLQAGEGVMSMAHAFAYAGCPSILMSLWQVNDHATAQLMESFYVGLADKKRKSEALREGKLAFLAEADPLKAHPYYWGGIVSIGDQRALGGGVNWLLWGIIAISILLAIGLLVKRMLP